MNELPATEKLMRLPALAEFMGLPITALKDLRGAGVPFPMNRSCQKWVMEWLEANPTFMPIDYRKAKSSTPSQDEQHPARTGAYKHRGQSQRHGLRRPSSAVLKNLREPVA